MKATRSLWTLMSRRPRRFLGFSVFHALLLLLTWQVAQLAFQSNPPAHFGLRHIGTLEGLSLTREALAVTVRTALATNDSTWQTRHSRLGGQLETSLDTLELNAPPESIRRALRQVRTAHATLDALEQQAFGFLHSRRVKDAEALISSLRYEEARLAFAKGMEQLAVEMEASITRQEQRDLKWSFAQTTVWLAMVGLILAGWLVATVASRRRNAERQAAEQTLRESEQKYRALFEQAADCVVVFDPETGRPLEFNEQAHTTLGYSREEFADLRAVDLGLDEPNRYEESGIDMISRVGSASYETSFTTKDGRRKEILLRGRTVELNGKLCIYAVIRDVTDRKRAKQARKRLEQRLQHLQKLESLAVLAGGVAHDFNNVLMGVLGNVDLALMEVPKASPAMPYLRGIKGAAARLGELTSQMLAYSGRGKFLAEPLNLSELIEEMRGLLKMPTDKLVTIQLDLDADLPHIEGDPSQLRQLLVNLVTNAAEASSQAAVVSIGTRLKMMEEDDFTDTIRNRNLPAGRYVCLEVSDNGCGMDEATRAKIFDPFFSSKFAGRGLGLSAVLGIVHGHGGAIRVESEPGGGSTFTIFLPSSDKQLSPAEEIPRSMARACESIGTVLVVDDEKTVRDVVATMLKQKGFTTLLASDGVEAVAKLREDLEHIDVVLLDLTMPYMDGLETLKEIRRLADRVPVVLSSGYNEHDAMRYVGSRGTAAFIQKPYSAPALIQTLEEAIAAAKPVASPDLQQPGGQRFQGAT